MSPPPASVAAYDAAAAERFRATARRALATVSYSADAAATTRRTSLARRSLTPMGANEAAHERTLLRYDSSGDLDEIVSDDEDSFAPLADRFRSLYQAHDQRLANELSDARASVANDLSAARATVVAVDAPRPPTPLHKVYIIRCAHCKTFFTDRGMRAILLRRR